MKNELTFIQCSRATIRATVSIMSAEFAETMKKKTRLNLQPCGDSLHSDSEMETCSDGEMQTERERQRDKISFT